MLNESKKAIRIILIIITLTLLGCGEGLESDPSGGSGSGAAPAPPLTLIQVGQAGSTILQSATLASSTGATLANWTIPLLESVGVPAPLFRSPLAEQDGRNALHLAEQSAVQTISHNVPARSLATSLAAPTSGPCSISGTRTVSNTFDTATNRFQLSITFSDCFETDSLTTGTISLSYTDTGEFTLKLGDGNTSADDTDFRQYLFSQGGMYGSLTTSLTATGTIDPLDHNQFSFFANGLERFSDFLDVYEVSFTNLKIVEANSTTIDAGSTTVNGRISESWGSGGADRSTLTFSDFLIDWTNTTAFSEISANGGLRAFFTLASTCSSGNYNVTTSIPLRQDTTSQQMVAGQLVINSVNSIDFNADGTLTTSTESESASYNFYNDLLDVCPLLVSFEDTSSATVVAPGETIITNGDTFLSTLTWMGGATSDMDMHLAHYAATSPDAGSVQDWHIYYADKISGGFGTLDFDDVEGYGPEHITMPTLPDGYYALYIDNYSLDQDTSATVVVSLRIGNNSFRFPAYTFTSDETVDHGIYRVVDVRVEGDLVTLLPPDMTLNATTLRFAPKFSR